MFRSIVLALALAAVFTGTPTARAQDAAPAPDPVSVYPDNYRVLLENDRVRVIDFRLAKGAKEAAHRHPMHVVYVITGFEIRFTLPGGETALRETRDGQVLFSEPVVHASENIGTTDAHGILVELKGAPPATAQP